jgi:isoleucyl-tRNA synthetase
MVLASQVWQPKRFDERQLQETAGGFLNTLRNSYQFYALYAGAEGVAAPAVADRPLADRWLLGRLDATVAAVRAGFDDYDVTTGVRALTEFVVDDLSNWWVRLNRGRFWAPGRDADPSAVATMHEALVTVARLLAPSAPFASDWLHRALTGTSVHLAAFPVDGGRLDPALDRAMDAIRRLASLGRAARETAGLKVRQPLATIRVAVPVDVRGAEFDALIPLLQGETNVKRVEIVTSDADLVRLRGKPNFRTLGKRFGADVKAVAASVARLTPEQLRALEQGESVTAEHLLLPEDVTIEREVVTEWPVASAGPFVVALDPAVSPALATEGLARELISRIQRLRKEAGFAVSARIELSLTGDTALLDAARGHAEYIAGETLALEFRIGEALQAPDRQEAVEIEGHVGALAVRQLGNGRTPSGLEQGDAS